MLYTVGTYLALKPSNNENSTHALIRTGWFKRQERLCIRFNYLICGIEMGILRLYVVNKSKSNKLGKKELLWEKLGDEENQWKSYGCSYTPPPDFQVRIIYTFSPIHFVNTVTVEKYFSS